MDGRTKLKDKENNMINDGNLKIRVDGFDFKPLIGKRIILHIGTTYREATILNVSESGKVKLKYEGTDPLALNSRIVWENLCREYATFEII